VAAAEARRARSARRLCASFAVALVAQVTSRAGAADPAHPADAAPRTRCDATTTLTLVGVDTASRSALFGLSGGGWVEVTLGDTSRARLVSLGAAPLAAASQGAGPLFVVQSCGASCLQPARLQDGVLAPLGEEITAPASATVTALYDSGGTAWIVLHERAGQASLTARTFRLQDRDWKASGTRRVTDAGTPGAVPIPGKQAGIVSGTGRFQAGADADDWLAGLPDLGARRGRLIPLGGDDAVEMSADGVIYRTNDRGAHWRRALWTPWSPTGVQPWSPGDDYEAELAAGDLEPPLPIVWFDHRDPKTQSRIVLSMTTAAGDWTTIATLPATIEPTAGEKLEVQEVLRFPGSLWTLVAGCTAGPTSDTAGTLVLRVLESKGKAQVERIPIRRTEPAQ
jgi:hypothetical protein